MSLTPFLDATLTFRMPTAANRATLFQAIASRAARRFRGIPAANLAELLERRECDLSTATPEGVAFPHVVDAAIPRTRVAVATISEGVLFDSRRPLVRLVFALFDPAAAPALHVRTLANLARIASSPITRAALLDAPTDAELFERLREAAERA